MMPKGKSGNLGDPLTVPEVGLRAFNAEHSGESADGKSGVGSVHSRGNPAKAGRKQDASQRQETLEGADKDIQCDRETSSTHRGGVTTATKLERIGVIAMIQIWRVMILAAVAVMVMQMSCTSVVGPIDFDPPSPPPEQVSEWDLVGLEGEEVSAIAVVASKPWVIFAGTMSDFSAGTRGKIFRSNDWGRTWREVARDVSVTRIVVDPQNPSIVYAGLAWVNFTAPGVIKSTDGGYKWFEAGSGMYFHESGIGELAIDPVNTNVLYAGESGFFGGALYKTTNGGRSWFGIPDEQPYPLGEGVTAVAIDPSNTNTVYAGVAWSGRVFKSTDAGDSWIVTNLPEGGIVDLLDVNHYLPSTLFAATRSNGFYRSSDSGLSWEKLRFGFIDDRGLYAGVVDLSLISQTKIICTGILARDTVGVFLSVDAGDSWGRLGQDVRPFGSLVLDRVNGFLYAAYGGIYRRKI